MSLEHFVTGEGKIRWKNLDPKETRELINFRDEHAELPFNPDHFSQIDTTIYAHKDRRFVVRTYPCTLHELEQSKKELAFLYSKFQVESLSWIPIVVGKYLNEQPICLVITPFLPGINLFSWAENLSNFIGNEHLLGNCETLFTNMFQYFGHRWRNNSPYLYDLHIEQCLYLPKFLNNRPTSGKFVVVDVDPRVQFPHRSPIEITLSNNFGHILATEEKLRELDILTKKQYLDRARCAFQKIGKLARKKYQVDF